jgi:hypothetical protein
MHLATAAGGLNFFKCLCGFTNLCGIRHSWRREADVPPVVELEVDDPALAGIARTANPDAATAAESVVARSRAETCRAARTEFIVNTGFSFDSSLDCRDVPPLDGGLD